MYPKSKKRSAAKIKIRGLEQGKFLQLDREENSSREKGRRGRGKAASCAPSEPHQHLHMIGLWENVKQINALDLVWAGTIRAHELRKIARQSGRVAGDIVNARGERVS